MKARFTRQFGTHGVGSEIELPDGVHYDKSYLEEVPDEPEAEPEAKDKEDAEAVSRLDNDGAPAPKDGDK